MEEIEAIPFCSASSEAATVSCSLQDGPHPRARSLVCQLGWTLDRSCLDLRLFSLALLRPHLISIAVSTRSVLSSFVKRSFPREIFVVVM